METQITIAMPNNKFRKSGQGVAVTQGVQGWMGLIGLVDEIRHLDLFTKSNDSYDEHDSKLLTLLRLTVSVPRGPQWVTKSPILFLGWLPPSCWSYIRPVTRKTY